MIDRVVNAALDAFDLPIAGVDSPQQRQITQAVFRVVEPDRTGARRQIGNLLGEIVSVQTDAGGRGDGQGGWVDNVSRAAGERYEVTNPTFLKPERLDIGLAGEGV